MKTKPDIALAIRTALDLARLNPNGRHVSHAQLRLLAEALVTQQRALTTAQELFKQRGDLQSLQELQRSL